MSTARPTKAELLERPLINIDLLRQTLEHIEATPDGWDQMAWRQQIDPEWEEANRCGTTMCFAGWAAELAGGRWAVGARHFNYNDYLLKEADDPKDEAELMYIGISTSRYRRVVHVMDRAARILGLAESDNLFSVQYNTLPTLRRKVNKMIKWGEKQRKYGHKDA